MALKPEEVYGALNKKISAIDPEHIGQIASDVKAAADSIKGASTMVVNPESEDYHDLLEVGDVKFGTDAQGNTTLTILGETITLGDGEGGGVSLYKINYDGTHIIHDGEIIHYADVISAYNDDRYFLFAELYGLTLMPALTPTEVEDVIEFVCPNVTGQSIDSLTVNIARLSIDSHDNVIANNITMATKDDLNAYVTGVAFNSAMQQMSQGLTQLSQGLSNANTRIDTINTSVNSMAQQLTTTADTLNARIDSAVSQMTVDSEVQDIRVGADGTTYDSAGTAVREQVGSVKADLSELDTKVNDYVQEVKSVNLFDLNNANNLDNKYIDVNNGEIVTLNYRKVTHLIEVEQGNTYSYKVSTVYSSAQSPIVWFYDENGSPLESQTGVVANGINTFISEHNGYVRVTYDAETQSSFMFVLGEYPSEYVPYEISLRLNPLIEVSSIEKPINIKNLFDKNDSDIVYGKYTNGANFIDTPRFNTSGFIPVEINKTYSFPVYSSYFGDSVAKRVYVYGAEKNYLTFFTGTIENDIITFTNNSPNVKYIRINYATGYTPSDIKYSYQTVDNIMVTESPFPTNRYYPFGDYSVLDDSVRISNEQLYSSLFGKKVTFLGDSICNGASAGDGLNGWSGRIGNKNNMLWRNAGISGATFTDNIGSSGCISNVVIEGGCDYVIIEGGTNDADMVGSILEGNVPTKFGSYTMTDYTSNFDKNTFCGAVESLFKRVTTDCKGAKIGFIIAQKMGKLNTSATDYTKEHNNRRAYFEVLIKLCEKWGIPYLNLWDSCYLNPMNPMHFTQGQNYLYTDGQHLTSNGYEIVYSVIESWMKTL